jgi:hypothetical protein
MIKKPFQPRAGSGTIVAPAVASANVAVGKGNEQFCFTNQGAAPCYVRWGVGAQVATTADYCVPPNAQVVCSKAEDDDNLAHISPTGTTLHIIAGEGW